MLKFYREILEKWGTYKKNVVDVNFIVFFSTIFRFQPIQYTGLIEFKNYFCSPLIDFTNCLPSCYADHYLIMIIDDILLF